VKTEQTTIEPLPIGRPAIERARECYHKWQGLATFEQDLADYLETGMVWSRPDLFAMAKVINFRGQPAWFVRVAVGNLRELLRMVPLYLTHICFCRGADPRLKAYRLDRLLKLGENLETRKP
jgi:hypothetical protein